MQRGRICKRSILIVRLVRLRASKIVHDQREVSQHLRAISSEVTVATLIGVQQRGDERNLFAILCRVFA
jgi:hypothetical protein